MITVESYFQRKLAAVPVGVGNDGVKPKEKQKLPVSMLTRVVFDIYYTV